MSRTMFETRLDRTIWQCPFFPRTYSKSTKPQSTKRFQSSTRHNCNYGVVFQEHKTNTGKQGVLGGNVMIIDNNNCNIGAYLFWRLTELQNPIALRRQSWQCLPKVLCPTKEGSFLRRMPKLTACTELGAVIDQVKFRKMLMVEAFFVNGWQTTFLDVFICSKSIQGVCPTVFSTVNP